jgi:glyoxylase-like metal-dependent hydrolase (beta-lactamase superfamily II)
MKLGEATLSRIVDIDPFALGLSFLFPAADIDQLRSDAKLLAPDHLDFETGNLLLGIQSFVLRIGDLSILIDSCVGEDKQRPRRPDWHLRRGTSYLAALAEAGVTPETVDIVLCTHLHADHVGWNTRLENGRWVPTFPRARYMIGRTELARWEDEERRAPGTANHGAFVDSILPVRQSGQIETVDEGFELARGVSILALPGHSPGQVGLDLDYGQGRHALFCGDAIHSPVQVLKPEWSSAFCSNPAEAVASRIGLLERSAEEGSLIIPSHIRNAIGFNVDRCGCNYRPAFVCEAE